VPPRPFAGLTQLLGAAVLEIQGDAGEITGIAHDSRSVRPGDLYAALPGAHVHGADFAAAALTAGAAAILTDRPGPHPLPWIVVERPREIRGKVSSWVYGDRV